jgi:ABC-type transporter Mla MlaB component
VLKITIKDEPKTATLRLEGRVAGPWVIELWQVWHSLAGSLGTKKLLVDLRGITHINADGQAILAEIYSTTGADFLADTPMTKYFAEEARHAIAKNAKGEN